ncbi:accessory factor associated with RNA polymerase II [Imshaugia aleurites]|uniref:Accessory factor associated with RNA polymerase II n=1 Tax=Imshaugia aleurites TaxID=172621 RepID=A0A8H3FZ30_9LECA|nr:accessory factor associated with RNA polymerase II [Imshaugia aleurites]
MANTPRDPLTSLRRSIASNNPPTPTTSPDAASSESATDNLGIATHLHFTNPEPHTFSLDTLTRFISSDHPVDLRSIYFAWQQKDVNIPVYIASAQKLSDELGSLDRAGSKVQNLVFAERLDLITWLEGASDESEYIKGLESDSSAAKSAQLASGALGGVSTVPSGAAGARSGKQIDPRLQEIYNLERKMGDRNSILRGIKPTDFSHIRKHSEQFFKDRKKPSAAAPTTTNTTSLASRDKKPGRRPDPIILLSPSASSLLRMSNIKSFLDLGTYIPPDSNLAGSSATANILHVSRLLPSIDNQRPFRFILVDTPEQFKPDYWNRVVAVFTTGQTWQFKSYRWQNAPDLFKNALGIYVGWRGEDVPGTVKGWGRGVTSAQVEKWNPQQGISGRWRDREVVEGIWDRVEDSMRSRGWSKDGGPVEK